MKIKLFILSLMVLVSPAFAMEEKPQEEDHIKTPVSLSKNLPWVTEARVLSYLDHDGLRSYLRTNSNSERPELKEFIKRCDEIYGIATAYVLEYLISSPDIVQHALQEPVVLTYYNLFTNSKIVIGNQDTDTHPRWLTHEPFLKRLKPLRTQTCMDNENRCRFTNEDLESFCSILKKMQPLRSVTLIKQANIDYQPLGISFALKSILKALKEAQLGELRMGSLEDEDNPVNAFSELWPYIRDITTLKRLTLMGEEDTDPGEYGFNHILHEILQSLSDVKLPLTDLEVRYSPIHQKEGLSLASLIKASTSLKRIRLCSVALAPAAMNHLRQAIDGNNNFESLELDQCREMMAEENDEEISNAIKGHQKIRWESAEDKSAKD